MDTNNALNFFGMADVLPGMKSASAVKELASSSASGSSSDFAGQLEQAMTNMSDSQGAEAAGGAAAAANKAASEDLPFDIKVSYVDVALLPTPVGQANLVRNMLQEQMKEQFTEMGKDIAKAMVTGMTGQLGMGVAAVATVAEVAQSNGAESTETEDGETAEASAEVESGSETEAETETQTAAADSTDETSEAASAATTTAADEVAEAETAQVDDGPGMFDSIASYFSRMTPDFGLGSDESQATTSEDSSTTS